VKKDQTQLVERLLAGDSRAFRKFYRTAKPILAGYLRKKISLKEDREELLHDIFLSFLDSLPLFKQQSSIETYLFSIARHEVADYWRKKYAKKALLIVPFVDQIYTEKLYSAAETAKVIRRVYCKLQPDEVALLKWKYEMGMSVKQIARKLEISTKAAESRLFRARQAFQVVYSEIEGK
jgi:RNA polymerase sigma-70 factor, ECF subfamily